MIRSINNKFSEESNIEAEESAELEIDDDYCEDDDSDLDEINRLLNSIDHIEPEPGDPGTENDNQEDELDEIIRLGGGEETFEFEEGNGIEDEDAGKQEMMRRFGLIRRSKERYSDESSASDEEEDNRIDRRGKLKLAPIDEQDAESMITAKEDQKSRFTNYSMSSAVIKRSYGLRQIDDHFEALYPAQYTEELEGEGPDEEKGCKVEEKSSLIDPNNSERFRAMLDAEKEAMRRKFPRELPDAELKNAVLRYAKAKEAQELEGNDQEKMEQIRMPADGAKRGRWDCESIVSMYSNIYNHPTEIREQSSVSGNDINRKRNNIGMMKSGANQLELMDTDELASIRSSRLSTANTFRPKDETPEERRQRKQAIKLERKERRQEKKANRKAFQKEKKKMNEEHQRNEMQKNRRTIK